MLELEGVVAWVDWGGGVLVPAALRWPTVCPFTRKDDAFGRIKDLIPSRRLG